MNLSVAFIFLLSAMDQLTILGLDLYKKDDIVEHARKHNAGTKKFALILIKSHGCDGTSDTCLEATQIMIDPYNTFVTKNFVLYHSAIMPNLENAAKSDTDGLVLTENPVDTKGPKIVPGSIEVAGEWSHFILENDTREIMGRAVVIDLSSGKILGHVDLKTHKKWAYFITTKADRLSVLKDLKADLLRFAEIQAALAGTRDAIDLISVGQMNDPICGKPEIQHDIYRQIKASQANLHLTNSLNQPQYYRRKP